jgi:RNA-directed DNA polymerase
MERIRARVGDLKVTRLVRQFLKAGVLEEGFLLPTSKGTPQGGVISPLLANVALCAIEERYERWVHHRRKLRAHRRSDGVAAAASARMTDRLRGRPVFFPFRYADGFVILMSGPARRLNASRPSSPTTYARPPVWNYRKRRPASRIWLRALSSSVTGCATSGIDGSA